MDTNEVKLIFDEEKEGLLGGIEPQKYPKAFILGGQPASGKSGLAKVALELYKGEDFLFVNGDIYREFHPKHDELSKSPIDYSEKTQIFSNVFTEGLIKEAIQRKINIIVEGTMRNPKVLLQEHRWRCSLLYPSKCNTPKK